MSEFRIEVRGSRDGIWGPWKEIRQGRRFADREAAQHWINRRQFVLRLAYRIIPPNVLRIEHRVAE